MKRLVKVIYLVTVFLTMAAPAAMAETINIGDYVKLLSANFNSGYGGDGAGIMTYAVSEDGGKTTAFDINTFCIQDNVDIGWGWYLVKDLSRTVGYSASDTAAGTGPLKGPVNFLFYKYASGDYSSYFNGPDAVNYEADFQNLLWSLQGEGDLTQYSKNSAWYTDFVNYIKNCGGSGSTMKWGTEVLNLVDNNGNDAQNQLYYNSDPVPEPSTLLMVGAGIVGIALLRKVRKILA